MGERNKKYFYAYLWAQLSLLILMMSMSIKLVIDDKQVVFGIVCIVLSVLFILFVLNLIAFHTYLLTKNLTTWEVLSWQRISYLQHWPRKLGSPFDLGCRVNWRLFCCYR